MTVLRPRNFMAEMTKSPLKPLLPMPLVEILTLTQLPDKTHPLPTTLLLAMMHLPVPRAGLQEMAKTREMVVEVDVAVKL